MKNIILPLIAIMLLAMPILAVPENITLGPFQVSFDAGKELHQWNVTEEESETYSGIPYVAYKAHSNDSIIVHIAMYTGSFSSSIPRAWNHKESMSDLKLSVSRNGCLCDTFTRTIDEHEGFVALIECHSGVGFLPEFLRAEWHDDKNVFTVYSIYPWDEGTLQLLKTIHVEKIQGDGT